MSGLTQLKSAQGIGLCRRSACRFGWALRTSGFRRITENLGKEYNSQTSTSRSFAFLDGITAQGEERWSSYHSSAVGQDVHVAQDSTVIRYTVRGAHG